MGDTRHKNNNAKEVQMLKRLSAIALAVILLVGSIAFLGCDEEEKEWELEIWSGAAGAGAVYVTSFAIADALTNNHPDINASAVESLGSMENLYATYELSSDRKENLIFNFSLNVFGSFRLQG